MNVKRQEIALAKAKVMVLEEASVVSKIDIQKAKLGVELAQLELDQAKQALAEHKKKFRATLAVRELQVQEADQEIAELRQNIDRARIHAPCDGIIFKPFVQLNNEKGRIEANKAVRCGDKLLELPAMDAFRGIIHIPASDYPLIIEGAAATLSLVIAPDQDLPVQVQRKERYPMTRNERLGRKDADGYLKEYQVELKIALPSELLRPGLSFQVRVPAQVATEALFLPRAAVHFDDAEKPYVWLPGLTGPRQHGIQTGRAGIAWMVITDGLQAGDRVLLYQLPEEGEPEEEPQEKPEPQPDNKPEAKRKKKE